MWAYMIRLALKFAPAVGLAVFLLTQGSAVEAGYVSAGLELVSGNASLAGSVGEMGAGTGSSAISASQSDLPRRIDHSRHTAVYRPSSNFAPIGGMAVPVSDYSGGSSIVAIIGKEAARHAELAIWLGKEGRAALPPPLSTGIFRPPRFVG